MPASPWSLPVRCCYPVIVSGEPSGMGRFCESLQASYVRIVSLLMTETPFSMQSLKP
jgi:hypothetical protein